MGSGPTGILSTLLLYLVRTLLMMPQVTASPAMISLMPSQLSGGTSDSRPQALPSFVTKATNGVNLADPDAV